MAGGAAIPPAACASECVPSPLTQVITPLPGKEYSVHTTNLLGEARRMYTPNLYGRSNMFLMALRQFQQIAKHPIMFSSLNFQGD